MPSLRPLKAKALVKILSLAGFFPVRQKGSHLLLKDNAGHSTVVPMHSNEEIDRHLLAKIIHDCGLDIKQFLDLLAKKN